MKKSTSGVESLKETGFHLLGCTTREEVAWWIGELQGDVFSVASAVLPPSRLVGEDTTGQILWKHFGDLCLVLV